MKFISMIVVSSICFFSSTVMAGSQWTGNNPWGGGIEVVAVYPASVDTIAFLGSDNVKYYHDWSTSDQAASGFAKSILATLLAALSSGKKVSVYYDVTKIKYDEYINFSNIILLKN